MEKIRQKKNTISAAEEYCKTLINVASNKIPAIKFQTALVITTSFIILVLAYGISQIKFQDDFIRYFDERYDFRVAADYMEDNLGGLQLMQYSVNSGEPGGINEPDYLKKVEKLTDFLRSSPRVSSVRSITDTCLLYTSDAADE